MNSRILPLVAVLTAVVPASMFAADFLSPLGGEQTVATSITTPGRSAPVVGTSSDTTVDLNRAWGYWAITGYGRFYGLMPVTVATRLAGAPPSYLVGDYNGDGCQDILVVNRDAGQNALVLGSSDGQLANGGAVLPSTYASKRTGASIGPMRDHERKWVNLFSPVTNVGANATTTVGNWQLRTGDINGDGLTDVVAQSVYEDKFHILLSTLDAKGVHRFQDPIEVPRPSIIDSWAGFNNAVTAFNFEHGTEVEVADFDGDGKADLMVRAHAEDDVNTGNYGLDRVVVFLMSKGDGSFSEVMFRFVDQAFKPVPAGHISTHFRFSSRFEVRVLDANGDGRLDLLNYEMHLWNDGKWDVTLFLNMGRRTSGEPAMLFKAAKDDDGRPWDSTDFPTVEGLPAYDWGANYLLAHRTEQFYHDFDGDGMVDIFRREVEQWVDQYRDTDASVLLSEGGGSRWAPLPKAFNVRLTGHTNTHQDANSSRTAQYGNMVLCGDIDGDAKADILSWQNGPDRTLRAYSPSRKRGVLTEMSTGMNLPESKDLHNLLLADVNGDGKQEFITVRNAPGLPMQVYQGGDWYEENLRKDPARGNHLTSQAIESVVVGGRPVLFKRHAEPGKTDGNLAWTSTRADGSWLPWQAVLLAGEKPYQLLDQPFTVADDGMRLAVIQRTAIDEYQVLRLLVRVGGAGDTPTSVEQYQEVVFNGSGTSTPMNDDDTLVTRPEAPWKFSVSSYFKADATSGTPLQNIQLSPLADAVGNGEFRDGDQKKWVDAVFVPGAAGQRLVMSIPRKGSGWWVVSLRTLDGRPAPRGVAATATDRVPQYYNRPNSVGENGSLRQAIVPDGTVTLVHGPADRRSSLATVWNQEWSKATNPNDPDLLMRTTLALKMATSHDQPDGTFRVELTGRWEYTSWVGRYVVTRTNVPNIESQVNLFHLPMDEYGIPAAFGKADGSVIADADYAGVRGVPYVSIFKVPGGGCSAPRLYQGVDGFAHVLLGRGSGALASQGGVLEALASTVIPDSIPSNRQVPAWAGITYAPALVPNSGMFNPDAMCVAPGQLTSTFQPTAVEYAISSVSSRGVPQASMWRSVVGTTGSQISVTRPRKLTSLDVQGMGFALINPQMVGVIESAPPLPPSMVTAGGKTSLTLESMSAADYQVSTSSQMAGRVSVDGKIAAFAFAVEGGGGTRTDKVWGLTTGSLEATSIQSVSRNLTDEVKAMRQLGQVVFLGDKAAIQAFLLPGTGRVVGISLTPVPGQTLTRVYPFGLRKSYLDLSNWYDGQAGKGYVLDTKRMNEEVRWTNDLLAARKKTLTLTGGSKGYNQGRFSSDADMIRKIDLGGLRNTYQWTAYGGFRAATEERSNRSVYDFTGFGDMSAMVGFSAEGSFGAGLGAMFVKKLFEITVMAGFAGEWSDTKSETRESGRGMSVEIDIDTDTYLEQVLAQARTTAANESAQFQLRDAPIDAIEFTTFFLPKSSTNYSEFYGQVLSSAWLRDASAPGSSTPAIIRDAQQNLRDNLSRSREIWRIAHRVTYVSRLYQHLATETDELK